MTTPTFSPETLMAFADGELDLEKRAEIERAIAADPTLAAEVERHRKLRRSLADAYGPLADEPVPDRLVAMILQRELKTPASAPRARRIRMSRPVQWLALAATLVVGVLVGSMLLGRGAPQSSLIIADAGGLRAAGVLDAALTERISSDASTNDVAIGLSFRDESGAYCRAFTAPAETLSGFACREEDAWRIRMTVDEASEAGAGDFRQASTALPEAVLRAIESSIAGDPLDAEAEAAARARNWQE